MKKELFFVMGLLIVISACTSSSSSSESNWRTGTQGIDFGFVTNNPPSDVLSTQSFGLVLEYSNKGAYSVNDLYLFLTGFDTGMFKITPSSSDTDVLISDRLEIDGKDKFNPDGTQSKFQRWDVLDIDLSSQEVDSFKQEFQPIACYTYETTATPIICIDYDKFDYVGSTGCDFEVKDLGSSQGAPIAVTDIKQKSTDKMVYLEIHFANKGKGTSYLGSNTNECYRGLRYDQVDRIQITEVKTSGGSFTCNPGIVRLTNGKGFTVCQKAHDSHVGGYSTPLLTVKAKYQYMESLSKKEITIINADPK